MIKQYSSILTLTFLLAVSSFGLVSCSQDNENQPIINTWISENQESFYLSILADNTVSSNIFGNEFFGLYELEGDSILRINIPLQNQSMTIDSTESYFNSVGAPSLSYYHEGELIATEEFGKISSILAENTFTILAVNEGQLSILSSTNETLNFKAQKEEAIAEIGISFISILRGMMGIVFLLLIAFLLSTDRKNINWRLVCIGVGLQLVLALLVLKVPFVKSIFDIVSKGFVTVLNFTKEGSSFLFGNLVTDIDTMGFIFAFQILPTIVFFAALTSALYYLGIIQWIVYAFAWIMSKTMKLSGAESLAAAGNIFLGQTESPLLVRPYLEKMTKSEIMCLMTGGMATIAGGVLGAYVGYLGGDSIQEQQVFASHLLAASIMSAPAAIVAAKMLVPESNPEDIDSNLSISKEKIGTNILDAISTGTRDGLKLAVNVGVMLLVFTAFMYMFNAMSFQIGEWTNLNAKIYANTAGRFEGLTLQYILGMIFSPVAWMLGVDWSDAVMVGQLLGEKTILNEFFAYASLGKLKAAELFHHKKSIIIATYALCGFANFASIGIQIGGISALAQNQQSTLAKLGVRALIGGTIACFMTATIAGMLY
jgi:concentrative nucleoside transporter, CNT family